MPLKLFTMDGFRDAAKEGGAVEDAVIVRDGAMAPDLADGSRSFRFVFSDGSVDRMGDTIDPSGWDLTAFKKNPVVLAAHDSSSISAIIGMASNVGVSKGKLLGDIEFVGADVNPLGEMAYRMVDAGILNAVSVGFRPIEYAFSKEKGREFGVDFKRQELVEISMVPIPANANALLEGKGVSLSSVPGLADMAEQIVNAGGKKSVVPHDVLRREFRAAKTPKAVRQKYLATERSVDPSTWKCAAVSGLALGEGDVWSAKVAAEHIFEAAGFDGDNPDTEMARSAFLAYDSAAPTLRASYRLPFCDVVDGELKAMPGGIRRAGESMEGGADIADDVQAAARSVMDGYEARIAEAAEVAVTTKIGAAVSAARKAMLQEAKGHHQSAMDSMGKATACVEKAMGSEEEPNMDDMPMDPMMDGQMDGKPGKTFASKAFKVGDRVEVKAGEAHGTETKDTIGTVKIVGTPALGIQFDGMSEVHKWYVEAELMPSDVDASKTISAEALAAAVAKAAADESEIEAAAVAATAAAEVARLRHRLAKAKQAQIMASLAAD